MTIRLGCISLTSHGHKAQEHNSMKKILFVSAVAAILGGCASTHHVSQTPAVIQTTLQKSDYQLAYGNDQRIQEAYEQYIKTGKAPNIITSGFEQFAFGASQPIISASPFELTVITLEKGESVTNASSGDPLRWSYSLAYSGIGKDRQAHIMVKPSQPSISTDMIITTDKRMYTIKIISTSNGKYLRDVRFWYPDDIQKNLDSNTQDVTSLPNIQLGQMNFDYSIDTPFFSSLNWKPSRVFDDGVHTYIQVPDSVSSSDLPAFFILDSESAKKSLVNYRFKKPYFVVDKIFKKAVLVLGVGSSQSKITIVNNSL